MTRNTIRGLVILAIISIGGIIVTQVYWFKRAFDNEEEQFNRDVNTALYNVASQFFEFNKTVIPNNNPIKQLSTNYYVVMINNEIDANMLEFLLKNEFQNRNIEADFEYGIYDCTNQKMVYGSYISLNDHQEIKPNTSLPKWENQNYYFGVQFPNKASIITERMSVWVFSSAVLIIVIAFFAYSLFVILKQKRLSEIQKDFINNMTHEFKTPISTIAISAEVLKNPDIVHKPERLLNYATIIDNESNRLKNQVERVLHMATVSNEEAQLNKEIVDIHRVINLAVEGIKPAIEKKSAEIQFDYKAANTKVLIDTLHFTNVIRNLLDNALNYSSKTPHILIYTKSISDTQMEISIEDNGIGIEKKHHKNIFNKFFRVPTGNLHDVKGFGLGLNYVALIIKAHHGTINLESNIETGSTFKIKLKNA